MNRSRWITLAVVVVLGGLALAWWKSRGTADAPKYRTAGVDRGTVEAVVSATGTVNPVVQVEVGSQVSGTVAELFADYNSRVRKGQVLLQLDPSSFKARLVQSEAAVARAEASLLDGQRQLKRAQDLLPQNYVSQADVDAADVLVKTRAADLQQARAQLDAARVDLANTTIRAPIDGVVISRNVDRGQTVAASLSAPKLFVIANDLSAMQIETSIDESDIGVIHPGLPATFTVDAFPDQTFRGEVQQVRLEPINVQNVVTYTTVIMTRNPDFKLRPGMTANVSVLISRKDDVVKVPNSALRFRPPAEGKKGGWGGRGAGGAVADAGGASRAEASTGGGRPGADPPGGAGGVRRDGRGAGAAADPPGGGARGAGGTDEYRRQLFEKVRSGEITREQAMELMRSRADEARAQNGPAGGGAGDAGAGGLHPGTIYVLRGGKPVAVQVLTGITDGVFTEVKADSLRPDDKVIVGLDLSTAGAQLPPGMRGPFGGRR